MAKLIAGWVYPSKARHLTKVHNTLFHDGVPTANIEYDENSDKLPLGMVPRYKVICEKCAKTE